MLSFMIRRIVATIPVTGFVALFVFSLLYIAPGDPAAVVAGDQASPAEVERIRQSLGLDRPYLVRFGEWAGRVAQGAKNRDDQVEIALHDVHRKKNSRLTIAEFRGVNATVRKAGLQSMVLDNRHLPTELYEETR